MTLKIASTSTTVRVMIDITIHRAAGETETAIDAFNTALWATQKDIGADVAEVVKSMIMADYPTTSTIVEAKRTSSKVLISTVEFKP